ncbi:hypothetical protein DFH94DRAFT_787557 [Russula ochroleuca]|uniref:Transmembrane protein n=1 Tax=Russula ochroleuca TaxID=152965 RepID=A0A9P5JV04_9AGAM|nr:hypothetical protein DFH94DRAFT_787557 [Russula ochroleuca]
MAVTHPVDIRDPCIAAFVWWFLLRCSRSLQCFRLPDSPNSFFHCRLGPLFSSRSPHLSAMCLIPLTPVSLHFQLPPCLIPLTPISLLPPYIFVSVFVFVLTGPVSFPVAVLYARGGMREMVTKGCMES